MSSIPLIHTTIWSNSTSPNITLFQGGIGDGYLKPTTPTQIPEDQISIRSIQTKLRIYCWAMGFL